MTASKINIYVYAHWKGLKSPKWTGTLTVAQIKSKKIYSFEYNPEWITSKEHFLLDPDISWFSGKYRSSVQKY